ncbi:hypothetical protein Tco_0901975 [Tanacetum coccineum]
MPCMVSYKGDLYKLLLISSDSSDESVGSPPSRVILFGDILTVIPSTSVVAPETSTIAPVISSAAPMVETTLVASPTGLCGLVPYTGSDSVLPDEMTSPEHISPLPAVSPFICIDSSDGPPLQDPYVTTIARWRSRVTAPPGIRRRSATLIRPEEAIPFGRPYRTHLNGPRKLLTARKRYAASLSTWYPPTTLESSSGDSSERPMHLSSHSARPSRKRCRSPVDSVPLSTPASIEEDAEVGLAGTGVDMELGIGDWDEVGDHFEIDLGDVRNDTEEYEADVSAGDTAEVGIDPMIAPLVEEEIVETDGEDSPDSSGIRDGIFRSVEDMPVDLGDVVRDFYHHMSEVRVDRIVGIETAQRWLEADQLIASRDRARMADVKPKNLNKFKITKIPLTQ